MFFIMIRDDLSWSELIQPRLAVRVDPVRLLYLTENNGSMQLREMKKGGLQAKWGFKFISHAFKNVSSSKN